MVHHRTLRARFALPRNLRSMLLYFYFLFFEIFVFYTYLTYINMEFQHLNMKKIEKVEHIPHETHIHVLQLTQNPKPSNIAQGSNAHAPSSPD